MCCFNKICTIFILSTIKEVAAHESRRHWTIIKKSEIKNKHKNKDGNPKTILSICSLKRKISTNGILMKHKSRICSYGGMPKWGVNYWETYAPLVNCITVRSPLDIASIHELSIGSIDFLIAFLQADIDVDVLMELTW